MADMTFGKKLETSADMIMPLPLTEDMLAVLDEAALTMEVSDEAIRKIYPEINIVPNTRAILIPIIPGITLYSYFRFFNVFPSAPAVDVYVNGKLVAERLAYREFTPYLKAFPGYYRVAVFEAGTRLVPLFTTFINLIGYRVYTGAISGLDNKASLELINDNIRPLPKKDAFLRVVQLSANAPAMDAYLDDSLVLSDINYKEVSRYLTTKPGTHDLKMREFISGQILVSEPEVKLAGGNAYTAYVIGDTRDRTGLQIIVEREGTSFLNF